MTSNKLTSKTQSGPLAQITKIAQSVQSAVHRHPKRMSAAVLALMAGSAMTAFGVAPLTALPDAATPTVRELTEPLPLPDLPKQLSQLDEQSLTLYRTEITRQTDTVDSLLRRLGVDDPDAAQFLRSDATAAALLQGRAGKTVQAAVNDGRLQHLVVRGPAASNDQWDTHFTRLTIERVQGPSGMTWQAHQEQVPLQVTPQLASGTILSSLYQAADDAKVPDAVTNQVAEIFSSDIDFRRELRKGDTFSVVYEALTADGEPISWGAPAGRVLAARFINQGVTHDAIWYQEPGHKGGYFDANGRSKNRAFLGSPLAFSRVTSGFSMRFHPILQTWRAHLGVDYGAPTGTPVRSVGDGVVSFAGQQNGYGNVIQLQHAGNRMTVYAHLSRIDVRRGQHVQQGQQIGAVGATGWATGPHLHFEFKINGKQVDPLSIARTSETTQLGSIAMGQFRQLAGTMTTRLNAAGELR
ncbi:MAG TPA: peptidoglycan DD-metalloendopeptidase family protein, partial [Aquabacterium sp.]|nr:peptidoglycan DD-metalloendopeptidase family protein [Aquabacterium sp.]